MFVFMKDLNFNQKKTTQKNHTKKTTSTAVNLIDILNLNTELWIIHGSVKSLHREVVHFLLSIIFIHESV